jgi:hypothetical protein
MRRRTIQGVLQVVLDVQQAISTGNETIESQTWRRAGHGGAPALKNALMRVQTQLDVLNARSAASRAPETSQARYDPIAAMAGYDLALSLDTQYVESPGPSDGLLQALNTTGAAISEGAISRGQITAL